MPNRTNANVASPYLGSLKCDGWPRSSNKPNRRALRRGTSLPNAGQRFVDVLPAGSEIVVDGYKAKNGWSTATAKDITFANGAKLFIGSTGTGAPYDMRK